MPEHDHKSRLRYIIRTLKRRNLFRVVIVTLPVIIIGMLLYPLVSSTDSDPAAGKRHTDARLGPKSIAVLPFTYLGAEDSTDYFSLGITDDVQARLGRIENLSVIGRSSVMRYRDTDRTLPEIGEELGVARLLDGRIQVDGNRVRIRARLIDASDATPLWTESYERELRDILAVQSEMATRIAESLEAELQPQDRAQLTVSGTVNETAYRRYLRGRYRLTRHDSAGVVRALALFRESIAHDSTFAQAYGGLAMAYFRSGRIAGMPLETAGSNALQAAEKALALDSTVVEAHLAQALVYDYFENEWNRSDRAFRRALRLNPGHSETQQEHGWYLLHLGRVDSALARMERAVSIDPRSWHAHHGLGYAYYCSHRYESAIRELETALTLGSRLSSTRNYLIIALMKRAQQLYRMGQDGEAQSLLTYFFTQARIAEDDQPLFERIARKQEEQMPEEYDELTTTPSITMMLHLLLDRTEPALNLMEQLTPSFRTHVFADPVFDPVRNNPRFKLLVERGLGRNVDMEMDMELP